MGAVRLIIFAVLITSSLGQVIHITLINEARWAAACNGEVPDPESFPRADPRDPADWIGSHPSPTVFRVRCKRGLSAPFTVDVSEALAQSAFYLSTSITFDRGGSSIPPDRILLAFSIVARAQIITARDCATDCPASTRGQCSCLHTWPEFLRLTKAPTSTPPPTRVPTRLPTRDPTAVPTRQPTRDPTLNPTEDPTREPTSDPTADPTQEPTSDPTSIPTRRPTSDPTRNPTRRRPPPPTPRSGNGSSKSPAPTCMIHCFVLAWLILRVI